MNDASGLKDAGHDDISMEKLPFSDKDRQCPAQKVAVGLRYFFTTCYDIKFKVLKQTIHVLNLAAMQPRAVIRFCTSTME